MVKSDGTSAQKWFEAYLLELGILDCMEPVRDDGIDLSGILKRCPRVPADISSAEQRVLFHFQVKDRQQFTVNNPRTFRRWVEVAETEPIILIKYRGSVTEPSFRFVLFFEYLLRNPQLIANIDDRVKQGKPIVVSTSSFQFASSPDMFVNEAVFPEARRTLRLPSALWRTLQTPLVPLLGLDLIKTFGNLAFVQTPAEVLKEIQLDSQLLRSNTDLWRALRNLWAQSQEQRLVVLESPTMRRFVDELRVNPSLAARQRERDQFIKFYTAMKSYDEDQFFSMPGLTLEEMACWRPFVSIFPESVRVLRAVIENKRRYWTLEQQTAALALTGAVSALNEPGLANAAADIIVKWDPGSTIVRDLGGYRLIREFSQARAEASGDADSRYSRQCADFIAHNEEYEIQHLIEYGWNKPPGILARAEQKIYRPNMRELRTPQIYEAILDIVNKRLTGG